MARQCPVKRKPLRGNEAVVEGGKVEEEPAENEESRA
jgi:hypothetical protein